MNGSFFSDLINRLNHATAMAKIKYLASGNWLFWPRLTRFFYFSTKICNEYDEYSLGKFKIMRSRNREYVNYVQRFIQLLKSLKNEDWMKWMDWRVAWHWRDSRGLYPISEQKQSSTGDFPTLFFSQHEWWPYGFSSNFLSKLIGSIAERSHSMKLNQQPTWFRLVVVLFFCCTLRS